MNDPQDEKTDSSPVMVTEEVSEAGAEPAPEAAASEPAQAEPETETETVEAPKKGAEARIKELNAKAKSAEEKAQSLEEKLAELTRPVGQETPQASYIPQVQPGQELTQEQYKADVLNTARAEVEIRVRQSEAASRINSEAQQVVRKYPELDPESEKFNKELSDSITEATEAYVRANPYTASPRKFVEKMMKPYLGAVTKEVGQATETIAKQVSQAASRPTAVSTAGGKDDSELSVAELEKKLGIQQY